MKILITGAGGPAAISVWKSLHAAHELYMADMDPMAAGLYLVPHAQRMLVPRGDASNFAETLLSVCKGSSIEICISTVDAELAPLARIADKFRRNGIELPLASEAVLALCRSKTDLVRAVGNLEVPIPKSIRWNDAASWNDFPAFAKPDAGSGSRGLKNIDSPEDLLVLPRTGEYVVQELLPHEEFSVDVFAIPTAEGVRGVAAVVRERMKTDSGIAVTARTVSSPELQKLAIRVVEGLKIPYVSNVQFKKAADGRYKFLEVNPRFPGTLPLTAIAGIDMPALLVSTLAGNPPPDELLPYSEKMIVRYMIEKEVNPREYANLARGAEI